jgi:hypothetical protein
MDHKLSLFAILALILTLLTLTGCEGVTGTPTTPGEVMLLPVMAATSSSCELCDQATLAAFLTREKNSVDAQAAATAEIMRANAQATLNAASSTLSAAQTQDQNNANVVAAQIAATAAIVSANAQATLNSAGSTQSAALVNDAIQQTRVQYDLQVTQAIGTQSAEVMTTQQYINGLAASTQTAVANNIATQTQSAVATSQWYTDQSRQRDEQVQASLWLWCPPIFILFIMFACLLFFWRWIKIRETQQRIDMQQEPPIVIDHNPRPLGDGSNNQYQLTRPRDHVGRWLEEVKRKLLTNKKDDDDNPDS